MRLCGAQCRPPRSRPLCAVHIDLHLEQFPVGILLPPDLIACRKSSEHRPWSAVAAALQSKVAAATRFGLASDLIALRASAIPACTCSWPGQRGRRSPSGSRTQCPLWWCNGHRDSRVNERGPSLPMAIVSSRISRFSRKRSSPVSAASTLACHSAPYAMRHSRRRAFNCGVQQACRGPRGHERESRPTAPRR